MNFPHLYAKCNPTVTWELFQSSTELYKRSNQSNRLLLQVVTSDFLSIQHEFIAIFIRVSHVELVGLE